MIAKSDERKKAIQLRKNGLTYSEVLEQVPVAKSTLSLWLRNVGLAKAQKQKITKKRKEAQKKGAQAKRNQRLKKVDEILLRTEKEVGHISEREHWLIGVALYWAEGTKESDARPGSSVEFTNSDPFMIRIFIDWLLEVVRVERNRVTFGIYIHENNRNRIEEVRKYWSRHTGFPTSRFTYVYYKKHNPKTKRLNVGSGYFGNLKIRVKASSDLCREISGWTKGIKNYCRIV